MFQRRWARCQVPHFSWFLVVLRPVSNTCLLPPEGALLCSSGHPGVKVTFPPGVTEEPRQVSMQVLGRARVAGGASAYKRALKWFSIQVVHMAGLELRALLEESEAAVSPLLCLSQSGPPSFLQPVTVQLPLPPGVTGEAACHRNKGGCSEGETTFRGALTFCHFLSRLQSGPLPLTSALPNTPDNHLG